MSNFKPSMLFWVLAGLALLWNLMGVMAFISQVTMSDEALAAMPAVERELYDALPDWVNIAFGISVITGTLACILLLVKRPNTAQPLFIVSLVAVLAQMTYVVFLSRSVEVFGMSSLILPGMVIIIAMLLVWWSKKLSAET